MNLNKKNFIILQAVVFIIIPIVQFLYGIYQFTTVPSDITVLNYVKGAIIPFYKSRSDSIEIPKDLVSLLFYSNMYSIWNFVLIPILSIIGLYRFQKTGSLRLSHGLAVIVFFSTLLIIPTAIFNHIRYEGHLKYAASHFYINTSVLVIKLIISFLLISYASKKIGISTLPEKTEAIEQAKSGRFLNFLIDQFFMYYLVLIFMRMTGISFSGSSYGFSYPISSQLLLTFQVPIAFLSVVYYAIAEGLFKTTFGKIITRTAIIDDEGETISFGTGLLRTIGRLIPLYPLSFLFGARGWHDSISRTYVVKAFYKKAD